MPRLGPFRAAYVVRKSFNCAIAAAEPTTGGSGWPRKPAIAEQTLDVFRRRVRGDIEILGPPAKQQVAHRAADQMRGESGFVEAIQHAQRRRGNILARDAVLFARNDVQMHLFGEVVGIRDSLSHSLFSLYRRGIDLCRGRPNRYTTARAGFTQCRFAVCNDSTPAPFV